MTARQRKWTGSDGKPKTAWIVDFVYKGTDGTEIPVKKTSPVNTKRGAEEFERQLRQSMLDGSYQAAIVAAIPPVTFLQFAERFMVSYVRANNKPSERASKRSILEQHLIPYFGDKAITAINVETIEEFKEFQLQPKLRKNRPRPVVLSAKTINNQLIVLGTILNVAQERGVITHVPKIKKLKVQKPAFRFLSFDETSLLLSAVEALQHPDGAAIIIALNTGLRLGELLGLEWGDINTEQKIMTVQRSDWLGHIGDLKSHSIRQIPLNTKCLAAILALPRRGPKLFRNPEKDLFVTMLTQHVRHAGLRKFEWHVLRHTFASHLAIKGVPLKAIQELLGHSTIEMTMRYAHLSPDVRKSAVDLL